MIDSKLFTSDYVFHYSLKKWCESKKNRFAKLGAQSNGWCTHKSTEEPPEPFKVLFQDVYNTLWVVSGEAKKIQWWIVCLNQYGYIKLHDHNQSDWSACYYLDDADDNTGGFLVFDNGTQIRPKRGRLAIFKGTDKHRVTTYNGVMPRYSIAFNRIDDVV